MPDRDGLTVLEVPEGATVAEVARRLGVPADMARVVLVNGADADPGRRLVDGDSLAIFPPLMGGET